MARVLLVYSSSFGQTKKISERLKGALEQRGHQVTLAAVDQVDKVDPASFDKVVLGASVRYGVHGKPVDRFIERNRGALESKPNAFFSVNLVARKPEKLRPEANPYLQKFLQRITWKPQKVAVFAGKLEYPRYGFLDRIMIQLIMKMTKGPTDPRTVQEYTNWNDVDAFADVVAAL